MRVMLVTFPSRTHVYSIAPVGWALRAAGHDVRFVGPRNPAEVEPFLETGLDALWVGPDLDVARHRKVGSDAPTAMDSDAKLSETRPEKHTDDHIRAVYEMWAGAFRWSASDALLDELLAHARQWRPDLVVWDPIMYAGPLVAHAVGAAHVRVMYAADQTARLVFQHAELRARRPDVPDPLADWMSEWLARHGSSWDETLRLGHATIDPQPACIRYSHLPVDYLPVRFVPHNRPLPMPRWVVEPPSRPRVLLTLGVSNRQVTGREEASMTELLGGLGELDIEVVATLSKEQLAQADHVPPNIRAVDFVPMNEVLASCSAIVHQGGGATVGNAVVNGVPQLIVPGTTWSERASALALAARGNGILLDLEDVSRTTVRDGVARMLAEPSFTIAAREMQAEMRATPTIADIVPTLEALAASRVPALAS